MSISIKQNSLTVRENQQQSAPASDIQKSIAEALSSQLSSAKITLAPGSTVGVLRDGRVFTKDKEGVKTIIGAINDAQHLFHLLHPLPSIDTLMTPVNEPVSPKVSNEKPSEVAKESVEKSSTTHSPIQAQATVQNNAPRRVITAEARVDSPLADKTSIIHAKAKVISREKGSGNTTSDEEESSPKEKKSQLQKIKARVHTSSPRTSSASFFTQASVTPQDRTTTSKKTARSKKHSAPTVKAKASVSESLDSSSEDGRFRYPSSKRFVNRRLSSNRLGSDPYSMPSTAKAAPAYTISRSNVYIGANASESSPRLSRLGPTDGFPLPRPQMPRCSSLGELSSSSLSEKTYSDTSSLAIKQAIDERKSYYKTMCAENTPDVSSALDKCLYQFLEYAPDSVIPSLLTEVETLTRDDNQETKFLSLQRLRNSYPDYFPKHLNDYISPERFAQPSKGSQHLATLSPSASLLDNSPRSTPPVILKPRTNNKTSPHSLFNEHSSDEEASKKDNSLSSAVTFQKNSFFHNRKGFQPITTPVNDGRTSSSNSSSSGTSSSSSSTSSSSLASTSDEEYTPLPKLHLTLHLGSKHPPYPTSSTHFMESQVSQDEQSPPPYSNSIIQEEKKDNSPFSFANTASDMSTEHPYRGSGRSTEKGPLYDNSIIYPSGHSAFSPYSASTLNSTRSINPSATSHPTPFNESDQSASQEARNGLEDRKEKTSQFNSSALSLDKPIESPTSQDEDTPIPSLETWKESIASDISTEHPHLSQVAPFDEEISLLLDTAPSRPSPLPSIPQHESPLRESSSSLSSPSHPDDDNTTPPQTNPPIPIISFEVFRNQLKRLNDRDDLTLSQEFQRKLLTTIFENPRAENLPSIFWDKLLPYINENRFLRKSDKHPLEALLNRYLSDEESDPASLLNITSSIDVYQKQLDSLNGRANLTPVQEFQKNLLSTIFEHPKAATLPSRFWDELPIYLVERRTSISEKEIRKLNDLFKLFLGHGLPDPLSSPVTNASIKQQPPKAIGSPVEQLVQLRQTIQQAATTVENLHDILEDRDSPPPTVSTKQLRARMQRKEAAIRERRQKVGELKNYYRNLLETPEKDLSDQADLCLFQFVELAPDDAAIAKILQEIEEAAPGDDAGKTLKLYESLKKRYPHYFPKEPKDFS